MESSKIELKNNEMDFVLNSFYDSNQNIKIIKKEEIKSIDSSSITYSYKFDDIVWRNVIAFIYMHTASVYGLYLIGSGQVKFITVFFGYLYGIGGSLGITVGAHRLWSHNAYKANKRFKIILLFLNSMTFQNSVYEWVRDHRVHHKFTDTNADPHNYNRGFFFAHMGWLLVKKHPDVKRKGAAIDLSDLKNDSLVMLQKKYYLYIMPIICFLLPTLVNRYVMNETWEISWYTTVFRYCLSLHLAWLVNSAAHAWGDKPFDKAIKPVDNKFLAWVTIGEGWHNYHHVFPWDYKAAELGNWGFNFSTGFLECFIKLGWAYDLKFVSKEMICKRASRTGDGTFDNKKYDKDLFTNQEQADFYVDHKNMVWGWHDKDLPQNAKEFVTIRNKID